MIWPMGKKKPMPRCLSVSPSAGYQCERPRKHNKKDKIVTHMWGSLVWSNNTVRDAFGQHIGENSIPSPVGQRVRFNTEDMPPLAASTAAESISLFDPALVYMNTKASTPIDEDAPTFKVSFDSKGDPVAALREQLQEDATVDQTDIDEQELRTWWMGQALREIEATVPKAVEYGSTDLVDIGSQMGRFIKRDLTDAEAAELGCWFYLVGKMARATAALERGDWPSDDTILDAGVYLKMIQRIRQSGGWPQGGSEPGGSTLNLEVQ